MAKKFKLTKSNYYSTEANHHYWSASFVKAMLNCQESAIAEFSGAYERGYSTALAIGSYVDSAFEGKKSMAAFKAEHPEIFNSRTGELKADFKQAEEMIARAKSDKLFCEYMRGQKQKIVTGTIEGIPFKCKLDVYLKDERIVDLKTVKDMEPVYLPGVGRVNFAEAWHWPLQMAIYQELVYQSTGKKLPCYLAVITKQTPSDIAVIEIEQETLDTELKFLKEKLPRMNAVKNGIIPADRCEKCSYCRETKVLIAPTKLEQTNEE